MFFTTKKAKEKKENDARLRRINNYEVRYVTTRDQNNKYGESIIAKSCIINIINDQFTILCNKKVIIANDIKNLQGSELLSGEGIILSYDDDKTGEKVEVIAYYKYHRK